MNDDQIDWNEVSFIKQLNELKTSWKCSLFIFVLLFGWLWWKMSKTRNCSSTESNEQNPMENICNIYIHHIGVLYVVYICVCVCVFVHNVDPYDKFWIKRRFKHKLRNIRILFNSRHNTLVFKLTILRFIDWTNRFNPHDCRRLNVLNSFLKLLIIVWWCKCGQVYANIHRWIPKSKICFK